MPREDDVRLIVQGGRSRGLSDDQIRALVARYDERQPPPTTQATPTEQPTTGGTVFGRRLRPDIDAQLRDVEVMGQPIYAVPGGAGIVRGAGSRAMELGRRAAGISKVRAAANMQAAAEAAKNVPVTMGEVIPGITRAKELQATGSRMPRVVTQIARRVDEAKDLGFREASDFASSLSRMSVNERNMLNPQMQRQVANLNHAVRQALTNAAGTVGKAEQYTKGVGEYAKASRAAERWEDMRPVILKLLRRGAEGVGLGYGASLMFKD